MSATARENGEALHLSRPGRFLWHYVTTRPTQFLLLLVLVAVASACAVAAQYQMKRLVDAMASGPRLLGIVWGTFLLFNGFLALESAFWRLIAVLACRATIGVGVVMRLDLFEHLSGQPMRYFSDNLAGGLGQRITGVAGNFGALTNTVVWRILPPFVDFLGATVLYVIIDWHMALAISAYVACVTGMLVLFGNRGRARHTAYFRRANAVAGDVVDVIANMWAVKAFSARHREWARLKHSFEAEAQSQRASWMHTEKTRIAYDSLLWLMAAGMLYWALREWQAHAISAGDVILISTLTFRTLHGAREVAIALIDVGQQIGYIEDTLEVIGKAHSCNDAGSRNHCLSRAGEIVFQDVSFNYDSTRPVLRDINLTIPAGEKVGIVGSSGAGKTTIIQLLQRLYEVQVGVITIDGCPIGQLTQDTLRAALAVVPQEIVLFHRSVLDNIRFGQPSASDEEVRAAAQAACCEDFIRRLPDGYHTLVGERGTKLSGGQRQRIGIARAFLKAAPILLLDEATSALDIESETDIQGSIARTHHSKTVVAVAHRLATLANYDRILVIEGGRIVEDGSPSELRRRGSVFGRLWRLQSEGRHALTQPRLRG